MKAFKFMAVVALVVMLQGCVSAIGTGSQLIGALNSINGFLKNNKTEQLQQTVVVQQQQPVPATQTAQATPKTNYQN